ncbi:hypothetical protein FHP29_04015 [Nocardioides albidus]|uniref:Uncharacterized protein n=1 Tax=Nocardioides albidus TaxID=1517589 RepID=A0A5C4WD45_9ACTN|nr:hypothetical protein [Nocardioides albidus]TNM46101.1 hypothetical protein FHP29_04015 [Nocardioides albidus]
MSLEIGLGRDSAGRAVCSASFVLAHPPGPGERLRDLVTQAVVGLDLVVSDAEATLARTRATVVLPDGPVRATGTGPFGQVSLSFTVEGATAGSLLQSLVERTGGPPLRVEAMTVPGPGATRRVRLHLGRLWEVLDDHLGSSRTVTVAGLARHLDDLVASGAVDLVEPPGSAAAREAVADVVVRRAVGVLAPADGGRYRVAERRPGDMEVTAMATLPGAPGEVLRAERPLGELLGDAGADPSAYLSMVTADGGQVSALLPNRSLTRSKAGPRDRMVMLRANDRINPVVLAAGGELTPAVRPAAVRVDSHLAIADAVTLAILEPDQARTPGPVVGGAPALWPDRFDAATHWYVPEVTLVVPDPAQPADGAPFRFDVTPSGHGLDGSEGLEATITLTLASRMPDDVRVAWEAAGSPTARPVPADGLTARLGVPFRDENGDLQVQYHQADSVTPSADFGADGGTAVAVFRLADQWARMAYGALSTPGFQAEPARVLLTTTYGGWRREAGTFPIAQPDKISVVLKPQVDRLAVLRPPVIRRARTVVPVEPEPIPPRWEVGIAPSQVNVLAKAGLTVEPRLHMNAALLAELYAERFEWARFEAASSVPVLVPCADHGANYRRVIAGEEPQAIGCQDVLKLGQAPFRTHEPITVAAAQGHATVLRSLTRPGHFVLVPERYRVGRFGPDADDRAFDPQLLLTSVLDTETAALRAVLATTVEADVAPAVRTAIVDELRSRSPQVVLDLPWAAGLTQDVRLAVPGRGDVQCVPTASGFTIVLTLDVSDFLVVKALLETAGLTGTAALTLPDGVTVSSAIGLSLSQVTGPYGTGPVTLERDGNKARLTNRIGSRVAVTGLRAPGGTLLAVDEVLGPGDSATVPAPRPDAGEYDAVTVVESSRETLEEVRVYIEDLEVEVVLVLTGGLGEAAALEVATTFDGRPDAEPVVLTATAKQEARRYVLPLTAYVADPVLTYVCTAVAADGTRTSSDPVSWSIRQQGAVIPVAVPPTTR